MNPNACQSLSECQKTRIMWTLLLLSPIIGMAVDLIAPSLPSMVSALHAPQILVKEFISIYILGYGTGNFFTGFLTDAWGRQKILRGSVLLFILICLLPVFFPSAAIVLFTRFMQGLTLGSAAVVVRTTFSDIFPPDRLIRVGTLMGTMFGLGPVIGPIIGAYLQHYFGWQAGFCFFTIAAIFMLIATILIVPETHYNRHPLNFKTIKTNLYTVFSHRIFMGLVILMGLAYGMMIAFNTVGPFLIQTQLGYSPIFYGHVALWIGLVFLSSTFVCRYLLKQYSTEELYYGAVNLFFTVITLSVILSYFFAHSIILISVVSALMYFSCGFLFPFSMGRGLALLRPIAGTATAMMFFLNMVITSFIGFLVSFVHVNTAIELMWIYFGLFTLILIVYWVMIREKANVAISAG